MNYIGQICEMLKVKVDVPFITEEDKYFCKINKDGETSWSQDGKHWEIDKVIFWHLIWGILTVYHKTYKDDFFEKFPNAPKTSKGYPSIGRNFLYGTEGYCGFEKSWDKEIE